jgi:two-component system, NarL family, nitrate/nitrite response regulator NarL
VTTIAEVAAGACPITCVVADDHPAVCDSVSRALAADGVVVLARVRDGDDALAAIREHRPEVAIVDVRMPGLHGVALAREAAELTAVVLYTGYGDASLVLEALAVGVRGFVLKEAPLAELVRAAECVAAGGIYVDPVLVGCVVGDRDARGRLTPREREVLCLLADGKRNEEIGNELRIAAETTRVHIRNAMRKLGAETRTQAVATALRKSLID